MKFDMTVKFPNLFGGTEISYFRGFDVFGITIYWYGILIAIGIVLAYLYASRRAKKDFGLVNDRVFDVVFAATIGGFLFARIYYCVFRTIDPNSTTKYNFITTFTTIRDGGIAIYGGIIGAVVVGFIMCKIRKVNFRAMADLASLGFLIGQCIGRWGNFINQEAYGAECSKNWLFAMTGNHISEEMGNGVFVHPCFLYESAWCLLGFILLHFYSKKLRTYDGETALLYVTWYGFGRMFIEGLRTDSLYWGKFRVSQVLGFASCVIAAVLFIIFKILAKKKGYVLYVNSDASKELIEQDEQAELKRKEKKEQKKALKALNEPQAPSILEAEDTEDKKEAEASESNSDENNSDESNSDENNDKGEVDNGSEDN